MDLNHREDKMDSNKTKELIEAIKKDSDVQPLFSAVAFSALTEKVLEKKKEIAKTLFGKKEAQ